MLRLFLFLTCSLFPLGAQEEPAKKAPPRQARFLPVGDMPPFRQEVRDGVRYELEPPPGSIPPREVVPGFGEESEGEPVRLQLGRISDATPIPAGAGAFTLRGQGAATPWVTFSRPEQGDLLVILWRDPTARTWEGARALALPDGPAASPPGSVHLLNLSPAAVAVVIGDEKIALPPVRPLVRRFEAGKDRALQVGASDGAGGLRRFHASSLVMNAGERTWVLIYRADGLMPRQPVKVAVLRERVQER